MARNLQQMFNEIEDGLHELRLLESKYPDSKAFGEFLARKEQDYREFLNLVRPLELSTFAPYVVEHLRSVGADRKFFGMTQRTKDYFKITKKLMKEIEAGD